MLQRTAQRIRPGTGLSVKAPTVICGEELRFLVVEQMRSINAGETRIILEALPRNTGPAVAAAAQIAAGDGVDPVLVVMPADHVIRDEDEFARTVAVAVRLCAQRAIIATFGIVPERADTGFGYIRRGEAMAGLAAQSVFELAAFEEKPNPARAEALVSGGRHYWNAGIFVARASVFNQALAIHAPAIAEAVGAAVAAGTSDGQFFRLDAVAFAACPSEAVDTAVMERLRNDPAVNGVVVPLDAGWSDVGSWAALLEVLDADESGNVAIGDVVSVDSTNSMQLSTSRLLTTVGVDGLVVVETPDAVFVARKDASPKVKELVARLTEKERPEANSHRRVHRPWGTFESLDQGQRYQVKRLRVNPGASLSLQLHHHRSEHWVIVSGTARVTRDDEVLLLGENESVYLPSGTKHRLENPGKVMLEVIEVQSGCYLGEDDIVRFEDVYQRI